MTKAEIKSFFRINVFLVFFVSFATITTNRHAIYIFNSVLINRWAYEKSQFTSEWSSFKIRDENELFFAGGRLLSAHNIFCDVDEYQSLFFNRRFFFPLRLMIDQIAFMKIEYCDKIFTRRRFTGWNCLFDCMLSSISLKRIPKF